MSGLRIRALTAADVADIATWRYDGQWSVYDSDGPLDPSLGYWAVVVGGDGGDQLVGFGCVGEDARVPGLAAAPNVLDVGVGMRPDRVGQGGGAVFASAFLDFVAARQDGARFRVVVQEWNERSLRLVAGLGFTRTGSHQVGDTGYAVLERAIRPG